MKTEEVRASFTIYIIASEQGELEGVSESLGLAGFMVACFTELTAAFSEFPSNPPHMIVLSLSEKKFDVGKAIAQIVSQLPESHVIAYAGLDQRDQAVTLLDKGVYDILYSPIKSTAELLKPFDRAAERDYFMYLNEQLASQGNAQSSPSVPLTELSATDSSLVYVRDLFRQKSFEGCLEVFMQSTSEFLGKVPAVFLKFIPNRRVLVATMVHGVGDVEWANAGIDFNEAREGFRSTQLRDPLAIEELGDLLHGIFGATEFFPNTVETLGEVQGVVCFLCPTPPPTTELQVQDWLMLLGKALSLVEAERRLHVVSTHDSATGLLTRQHFLNRISQEVSRARRTSTPVSLALMAVDQYGAVVSQFGPDDAQVILRMVARIFEKHSRVNDIVGRTGTDEFGILLPHTGRRGALIKAERLRRIIESADFSRVLKSFPQLTISIGVAEYPSMSRDADELLQTADEALYQVRGEGNKTCVAKPPEGFTPDFVVADKGPE